MEMTSTSGMKRTELVCICCPLGCALTAEVNAQGKISVTGNTCPRGEAYAQKELTNPTRIVTSTVPVIGGNLPVVSVKTAGDIPKDKIFDCIQELKKVKIQAPIHIGDSIIENVCGTTVNIVATSEVVLQYK